MSMGSLPGAYYQGSASTQAQFQEFLQFQQKQAATKENERLQSESEAKQQASNASSGDVEASKRKDQDDAAEYGPAKKPRTG